MLVLAVRIKKMEKVLTLRSERVAVATAGEPLVSAIRSL